MQNLKGKQYYFGQSFAKRKVAQPPSEPSVTSPVRNITFAYKNYLEILLLGPIMIALFLCTVALASISTKCFSMHLLTLFYLLKIIFDNQVSKLQFCCFSPDDPTTGRMLIHRL